MLWAPLSSLFCTFFPLRPSSLSNSDLALALASFTPLFQFFPLASPTPSPLPASTLPENKLPVRLIRLPLSSGRISFPVPPPRVLRFPILWPVVTVATPSLERTPPASTTLRTAPASRRDGLGPYIVSILRVELRPPLTRRRRRDVATCPPPPSDRADRPEPTKPTEPSSIPPAARVRRRAQRTTDDLGG